MRPVIRYASLAACLLSTVLACSSAHAEGGAAQAVSYSWTGLYGGINAGYGWGKSDWDFVGGGSNTNSDNSGLVGLTAGYGGQIGNNWYLGLEASLEAADIDGQKSCLGGHTCETYVSALADISARAGIISGPALFYVKGGVAYEDAQHHIKVPGQDVKDNGGGPVGYVLGAGAEYPLMYDLTTKIEYNYMDFGSSNYDIGNTRISAKQSINLVKLGFNLKFAE